MSTDLNPPESTGFASTADEKRPDGKLRPAVSRAEERRREFFRSSLKGSSPTVSRPSKTKVVPMTPEERRRLIETPIVFNIIGTHRHGGIETPEPFTAEYTNDIDEYWRGKRKPSLSDYDQDDN